MKEQNLKNHARMVPGFHYLTFGLLFVSLIISGIMLVKSISNCGNSCSANSCENKDIKKEITSANKMMIEKRIIIKNDSTPKKGGGFFVSLAIFSLSMGGILLAWFARVFALKAQDRAIRAEESLRYFILSGKPMDERLKLGQIIALRFASNEEFLALCDEAAEKGLSRKDIKAKIKNWRADNNRV